MESLASRALLWGIRKVNNLLQQELYEDLYFSPTHIRLLELLPESDDCKASTKPWYEHVNIRCNLIVVEIDKAPAYDALSYTWGNGEPSIEITVNGNKVMVRRNLADALAALRGRSSRLLWNDALCINQTSDPERSHQVQLMGDIYRQAATVFVWLGRSDARTGNLSSEAILMLERFAEAQPISTLPPAPPDASVPQEAEFDRWIQDLRASYNWDDEKDKQRWLTDWRFHMDSWKQMKQERIWAQRRRARRPDIIAEKKFSEVQCEFLREELRVLRESQTARNGDVAELQTRVYHYEQAMNAPLSRLLKLFLVRQEQVFLATDFSVQISEDAASVSTRPIEVHQLYCRIDNNLGEFQRYLVDRRELLTERMRQGFNDQTELDRLNQWRRIEIDERRALSDLRKQYQSWSLLEQTQAEALRKMKLEQDMALQSLSLSWDSGRKEVLHQGQDLRLYEAKQRDKLKKCILEQASALESMEAEHDYQCARSPALDPRIDDFLEQEDLRSLAHLKDNMRGLHKQLLAIHMAEILAHQPEMLLRQQANLLINTHTEAGSMPTVEEERKQMGMSLIQTQNYLVRTWKTKRKQEVNQWQNQVLHREADESSLIEMLLALVGFCNLRYWTRLWIVQEVLLAKEIVLCFGDDARTTRDWSLLSKARRCLDSIPVDCFSNAFVKEQIMTVQQSFPFLLDRLREDRDEGWPLHRLVEITKGTRCTHPRDKVYGLLGLANDCHKGDILTDIKKSTQEVFQDTIQWYHQKYGSDDSYPSIIRLSKSMQLSFRTYDEPPQQRHDINPDLDKSSPRESNETNILLPNRTFCVKGVQKGPIIDLTQLLDNSKLLALRQRDWIGLMTEYLDFDGTHNSRMRIEEELVYLSSIQASFAIKNETIAYGTCEEAGQDMDSTPPAESLGATALSLNNLTDEQQFFIMDNGQFGVASACIRENDILCEFEDEQTALILRRETSHRFALVSRAILSRLSRVTQVRFCATESDFEKDATAVSGLSAQPSTPDNRAENPTLYVHLDATSLQQLTQPYEISGKHQFREESFVQEADFGWHEFMTFGIDIEAESLDASVFTSDSVAETGPSPVTTAVPRTVETPVPVVIDEALSHTPEFTANIDLKDPLLLESLKLALLPQPSASRWSQIKSHGLLLDIGSSV